MGANIENLNDISHLLRENANVLIAEDDKNIREHLQRAVDRFFPNVFVASDGQEALEIFLKEEDINILLTDIKMPRMNGVDLIKNILSVDEDVFVIVLSAHNNSDMLIELINIGVNNFLPKPIDMEMMAKFFYNGCLQLKTTLKLKDDTLTRDEKKSVLNLLEDELIDLSIISKLV
ncbi:MAG: response regulator [Sulfurimonas sp.]|nr:response regulator [Sulfurimonas sp.]